jgi:hypothetical protein
VSAVDVDDRVMLARDIRGPMPPRKPLPWGQWTVEARIGSEGGHKVHLQIDFEGPGDEPETRGQPVEFAVTVHKEGAPFRGLLDTIAASASQTLQHGGTIREVIDRMLGVRFEPDGDVKGHESIVTCLSLVDLVGQMLAAECLPNGGAK